MNQLHIYIYPLFFRSYSHIFRKPLEPALVFPFLLLHFAPVVSCWKLTSAWSSPPTPSCWIKLPAPIPAFPCCEIFNPAYFTGPSFFCKGSSYKGHCGPDGLVKMTQLYLHSVKCTHRQYLNKRACLCPIKFYLQNRQWAGFGL